MPRMLAVARRMAGPVWERWPCEAMPRLSCEGAAGSRVAFSLGRPRAGVAGERAPSCHGADRPTHVSVIVRRLRLGDACRRNWRYAVLLKSSSGKGSANSWKEGQIVPNRLTPVEVAQMLPESCRLCLTWGRNHQNPVELGPIVAQIWNQLDRTMWPRIDESTKFGPIRPICGRARPVSASFGPNTPQIGQNWPGDGHLWSDMLLGVGQLRPRLARTRPEIARR